VLAAEVGLELMEKTTQQLELAALVAQVFLLQLLVNL
jgi:hypothetical protein